MAGPLERRTALRFHLHLYHQKDSCRIFSDHALLPLLPSSRGAPRTERLNHSECAARRTHSFSSPQQLA